MGKQKATYYCYDSGKDPATLKIGSMVFDLKNPNSVHGRYAHEAAIEDKWTTKTPFEPLTYKHQPGWQFDIGVSLDEDLQFSVGAGRTNELAVTSPRAKREEIEDKLGFFQTHILSNEKALAWLQKCISVARFTYLIKKMAFQQPRIWVLMGVYTLEEAKFGTVRTREGHIHVSISAPVIAQAFIDLNPGISTDISKDCSLTCDGKIPGFTVWAGQWARLKIDFLPRNKAINPDEISLFELRDLGGPLRTPGDSADIGCVVQLSLDDDPDSNDFPEVGDGVQVPEDVDEKTFWDTYQQAWAQFSE